MTIFKILACAAVAASALISPALAQPDLPAPKTGTPGEARKFVHRPLFLSPDGRLVAVIEYSTPRTGSEIQYDSAGSQVSLWEVATGRLIWRKQTPANSFPKGSFSLDGSRFLCHGAYRRQEKNVYVERKNHVHIWDTISGASLTTPELEESEDLQDLVFSPDGKQLAGKIFDFGKQETTDLDAHLIGKLWDAKTGKLLRTMRDKPHLAQQAHWQTQGNRVVANGNRVGGENFKVTNKVVLWSWPELELVDETAVDGNIVQEKALSPDGKRVAFSFVPFPWADDKIHLWDVASKKRSIMKDEETFPFSPHSMAFLSDGTTLVTTGSILQDSGIVASIRFWNSETGEEIRRVIPGRSFAIGESSSYRISLLPDDKHYVTAGAHGKVELRSLENGALIRTFE